MNQIEIAKKYIGKKEKLGNSGFEDPEFERDMIAQGAWQKGFAWCACFARMVFIKAYPEKASIYKKLLSPSTRTTYDNLKGNGYPCLPIPVIGALVVWATYRSGIKQSTGHAAIVTEVFDNGTFKTIEGNGSENGSRNGDRVVEHVRTLDRKPNGLNVLGFFQI